MIAIANMPAQLIYLQFSRVTLTTESISYADEQRNPKQAMDCVLRFLEELAEQKLIEGIET
jgi:hypothetical protein